ncbi:MAG: EAL domain-containing protein [Cyanobacteria bacterium Co-bin8]|nr:EAL domain-containing protein [Cyanobacteria bacterium Co-bin8]
MVVGNPFKKYAAIRSVLVYAFTSACWILVSDYFLEKIVSNELLLTQLQTLKGWFFVLATSGILYGLLQTNQRSQHKSYTLLQKIVEGTTDAIFVKDRQGRYIMVNSVTASILGQPVDAILNREDTALMPAEMAQQIQKADQEIMARGQPVSLEEQVLQGSQIRTFWSTKYVWRNSQGHVQGLIGIARDLTEYKQLQEERQQLIANLQAQAEDLQALHLITANAVSTLNLEELLSVLLDRLMSVTQADAAMILLSQNHSLYVRASRGLSESEITLYNSIVGEGFAGTVFQTGKPLYVEDASQDLRFRAASPMPRLTHTLLGVPLQRGTQRIGVLQLEWQNIQPYQERILHLLEIIGERCTLAILNAQLFEQTQALKERLQLQIDRMPVGCIIHDQEFRFVDWNQAAESIFGYTKAEVLGQHPFSRIVPPSAQSQVNQIFQRVVQGDMTAHCFNENQTCTGRLILCSWHNTPLLDAEGNFVGLLSMVQDVTEQKQAEEQLKRLAYFDPLTSLPRRSLFLQRLEELIEAQRNDSRRSLTVLYLDIERFKFIKYSLGHHIAEALLIAIARRLEACLHPPVMIARLESDEFAVLLEYIADASEADHWAELIQQALAQPIEIHGHCIFIQTCIGIAHGAGDGLEASTLLRSADIALHQAKQTGTTIAVFSDFMEHQVTYTLDLDTDLRLALERQQFQLYYQPIVNLHEQTLVGFEALLRWHHPHRGAIPPDRFIPLAEQTGLILTIGDWVIESACQQIQHWQHQFGSANCPLVSINLSALQLRQTNLLSRLEQVMRSYGLSTDQLKLEITESAIVENASRVSDLLITLKKRQISIVVDDFGTGYSSLSYLHQFPFDMIKIDRSFIHRLSHDLPSQEIVRTIINLAHNLDMTVTAEGIETIQQLELLQKMGCDLGQGYLFAPAVASTAAEQFIISRNSWQF